MKNFKWGTKSFDESPIYVVLFVSRKKDNTHIENFVERRESFITHHAWDSEYLQNKFNEFVNRGKNTELSRMYFSVNERDPNKIYKELLHFLIDNPDFNLCSISPKLAGIAATKECALSKRWMFDFDNPDINLANEFINDISKLIDIPLKTTIYPTPHGFAIVTERGFDCRSLLEKYNYVTLKRDDLLCVKWSSKNAEKN